MGIIAYAGDFIVSSEGGKADSVWDETTGALGEIGLKSISSSRATRPRRRWDGIFGLQEGNCCSGTEATEWTSMTADDQDASLVQKRLNETSEFAGHVEAVAQPALGLEEFSGFVAHDLEVDCVILDFDAKVVNTKKLKPLVGTLEATTKCICEKLLERALDDDDWTRIKLPTSLGGLGIRAATSQLETSFEITVKKTRTQADRTEKKSDRKTKRHELGSLGTERYGTQHVDHEDRVRQ